MRRDRCYGCGAREWVPDPYRSSAWQPLAVIVLLAAFVVMARSLADPARRSVREDVPIPAVLAAAEPLPAVPEPAAGVAPPASLPAPTPDPRPEPEPQAAATSAEPLQADPALPQAAPEAQPPPERHQLLAVTPRWTGSEMEVLVKADAIPATYSLIYVASSGGYVLDLPGVWQISPQILRSRSFTRSNLAAMDVGLHPTFLRLVFRTLQPEPAPRISVDPQGLRVLL